MAGDRMRLDMAITQFLNYLYLRKGRSETTITTYRSVLMGFCNFSKNCYVDELSINIVDRYAESLMNYSYSPKTIRNKLSPIRSLFSYLYVKDEISIRHEKIDLPKVREIEANFLDDDEQQALLAACRDVREKALILFLLRSGLRVSELINAETADLFNRSLIVRNGKGGKSRVTFITPDADEALSQYRSAIAAQKYLFPNMSGQKMSRQYVARLVSSCATRAGIGKQVSPQTLRHTFATNLLMRGARAEDVQPMMGHSNIRTTRIYMHFTNDYLHDKYDEYMKKPAYTPQAY